MATTRHRERVDGRPRRTADPRSIRLREAARRRRRAGHLVRQRVTARGRDFEVTEDDVGIVEVRIV